MNTALFIAKRYFLSGNIKNFINVISIMSMVGVAFGTIALIVVLSVFNGLEDLIRTLYSTFDPELKISPAQGKSFEADSAFIRKINKIEGVDIVTEVIEDWAYIKYREDEKLIKLKGVSPNFVNHQRMDSHIVEGRFLLEKNAHNFAIVGRGIASMLMINIYDELGFLHISYPVIKDKSKLSFSDDPSKYYNNQKSIKPIAIFAIERQYDDNYIFVPLNFARDLMDYGIKRTALEIKTKDGHDVLEVQNRLQELLGNKFIVQNSDEQHSSLLKAIKTEKLFLYITFSVILLIASLNILFSLSMLAIEKKKDVAVLFSLGASRKFIKKLFLIEGFMVACVGAVVGLLGGFLICFVQQEYGLVSMGMQTSIVEAYPVKMEALDFVFTGIIILVITFAISYRPAAKAAAFHLRENLK